ncbi:acyltransferase [Mucilaginibacter sp. L3T2-6]|uniref:acyltransferase family protein n=1 Tax=Mucilaginibacter sp. L3T2-6 TaxID=3062491 RepID=UPI0026765863|nr:acyltransferase [Mucilaginibacter sp. L3T2-6]MDO3645322.1 acyltransferase [Mucilaginibacter sp. L3T2-6]MDV6217821.1 acyltransferase [Mucilaginibacter sp. L3T2-6]
MVIGYLQNVKRKLGSPIVKVPDILQPSYFPALDGLRGIAILLVILTHFGINKVLRFTPFFGDSRMGVDIFFVLSGFLITTLLIKEQIKNGRVRLKRFYLRRVLRIIPLAYLFLTGLLILNINHHLAISALDFAASFLFFKNLPLRNEPYTAHFWTLAVEEQFYLVFPFLLSFSINRYFFAVLFVSITIVAICFVNGSHPIDDVYIYCRWIIKVSRYFFWKGPMFILIGSLLSILLFKQLIVLNSIHPPYFLSFILLTSAIVIHNKYFVGYMPYISEYFSAILIAWVILISLRGNDFLARILCNSAILKIGLWSYSLYIWQELFIGANAWQPWMRFLKNCPFYLLLFSKLTLTFLISYVSYTFFESKFLSMKKSLRGDRPTRS